MLTHLIRASCDFCAREETWNLRGTKPDNLDIEMFRAHLESLGWERVRMRDDGELRLMDLCGECANNAKHFPSLMP